MKKLFTLAILALSINAFAQIPTNGLLAYWPFNGNANDASGNGYNGLITGATLVSDRFGLANSAYYFSGPDKIVTAFQGVLGNNARSVSFWSKVEENEIGGYMLTYGGLTGGSAFSIALFPEKTAHLDINNATVSYNASKVNDGIWHHYIYIFSTSFGASLNGLRIYQDGVLLNQITNSYNYTLYNINTTNTTPFQIGKAGNNVVCCLDDIRFYNRVLDQSEITALFNENICYQTITVTDTLVINVSLTGFNPITYANTIKVYPNPTFDHITIDYGNNFSTLTGYTIKILNSLSQTVYTSLVSQQITTIDLNSWTGNGIYFLHLIDGSNNTIDIKKIVLQ